MLHRRSITIAGKQNAPELTALSVRTFLDAFAKDNTKEDMDKYIAEEMSLARLTEELSDQRNIFFLAYYDDTLIGYAKVRDAKIPQALQAHKPLEIERIYVLQQYHNTGTGAALMQQCIDHAVKNRYDIIWLGVWGKNDQAINFYKRWGFDFFGSHTFVLGNDHQTDVLMKKHL